MSGIPDPDPAKTVDSAIRLLRAGKPKRAFARIEDLAEQSPGNPGLNHIAGMIAMKAGRVPEARRLLERAFVDPAVHREAGIDLATLLSSQYAYRRAIEVLERLRRVHARDDELDFTLANVLNQAGDTAAAEAIYAELAAGNPSVPAYKTNLALLHQRAGRMDEAARLYRELLDAKPDDTELLYELAFVKRFQPDDPDIARIERFQPATLKPQARMYLDYARAKMLNDLGRHDEAYAALDRANSIAAKGRPYRAKAFARRLDAVRAFDPEAAAPAPKEPAPVRPIFIIGLPRSGTTLVEQILCRVPRTVTAGEPSYLEQAVLALAGDRPGPAPEGRALGELAEAPGPALARVRAAYLERLAGHGPAERVIDKNPENFWWARYAIAALPEAQFLLLRRDPLDVWVSLYERYFPAGLDYAYAEEDFADYHAKYQAATENLTALAPGRVREIDYAAFCNAPEAEGRALFEFLGLAWTPEVLQPSAGDTFVRTASVAQVREPISTRSIGRGKNFGKRLDWLRHALEK